MTDKLKIAYISEIPDYMLTLRDNFGIWTKSM